MWMSFVPIICPFGLEVRMGKPNLTVGVSGSKRRVDSPSDRKNAQVRTKLVVAVRVPGRLLHITLAPSLFLQTRHLGQQRTSIDFW